jgi:hypothetical protein
MSVPRVAMAEGRVSIAAELRIVEWQNELVAGGPYRCAHPPPDELLRRLREEQALDAVIAPADDELGAFVLLRDWVASRFRHGFAGLKVPVVDSLELLAAAADGYDFNCGYYAMLLTQSLQALGFVTRQISLCKADSEWVADDEPNIGARAWSLICEGGDCTMLMLWGGWGTGHSVMEVWSHQFSKWILLDADLNLHYERRARAVPLSALEIHHAWQVPHVCSSRTRMSHTLGY